MMQRLTHKDWIVLLMPVSSDSEWQFSCCPQGGEPLVSARRFPSSEMALASAQIFIDCFEIRLELSDLLDDWLEEGRIAGADYLQATRLIASLVRRISDPPSIDPRPLEPPAQNPPDPSP